MSDHLKPYQFKAGEPSGNPGGRPALTEEERSMRENFRKSFSMLGNKTLEEIKAIAADVKQPAPMVLAAKALEWAMKKGNPGMYREIYDRTLGKVTQHVEIEMSGYDKMSTEDLKKLVAERMKPNE